MCVCVDCAGRDAIGQCAANQNPVVPGDKLQLTGKEGGKFNKGEGGHIHPGNLENSYIREGVWKSQILLNFK